MPTGNHSSRWLLGSRAGTQKRVGEGVERIHENIKGSTDTHAHTHTHVSTHKSATTAAAAAAMEAGAPVGAECRAHISFFDSKPRQLSSSHTHTHSLHLQRATIMTPTRDVCKRGLRCALAGLLVLNARCLGGDPPGKGCTAPPWWRACRAGCPCAWRRGQTWGGASVRVCVRT